MSTFSSLLKGLSTFALFAGVFLAADHAFASPEEQIAHLSQNVDRLFVIMCAGLVYLMQAGFMCFEVGCVREKNIGVIALKNTIDWIMCTFAFFMVGFALMFGASWNGVIGTDLFFLKDLVSHPDGLPIKWVFFMFHVGFAGTALTIVSGSLAERVGFMSYLCASFLIGLVIYPVFGHWAWGGGFLSSNEAPWLAKLGFVDFAGSTVVHSLGAWVALVGSWFVGPRLGRYDAEGNIIPMKGYSIPWSVLGLIILWFGWWGFNGGSNLSLTENVGKIIFNTNLSATAAGLAAFFHCFYFQKRRDLNEKFMGGLLSGLVAITAGCNIVTPLGAVLIGLSAGFVHNMAFELIARKWKLDDPVGAIPIHGFCGAWGTLALAFFAPAAALPNARLMQIGVQGLGIVTCFVWTTVAAYIMFRVLKSTVGLRVSPQEERAGLSLGGGEHEESEDVMDQDEVRKLMM